MGLGETITYTGVKYVLMALVIAGIITIPMVFQVRGEFAGRFFTALWTLIVVAVASWFATKTLKIWWKRRDA